ncbi:MAG: RluA family pseudouridine synthase [Clostridia bacterium]|nr:RluA family pseudouridine synthase [Clostridia bacterium]
MIKIYYNDDDIVVCEKTYGISSQKSGGDNMVDMLSEQLNCEIFPVHRLDTTTTGVMVFAKTEKSASALSKQIADRRFQKEYLLVCHGSVDKSGEMRDFLFHDRIKNKSFVVKNKRNGSKEAILEYETISYKEKEDLSLVKVVLHTGRTHQIRVQFSYRGHSLYGDGKYGATDKDKIALHSQSITFMHPLTNEILNYRSYPTGQVFDFGSEIDN